MSKRYEVKEARRGVWTVTDTQTGEIIMRERDAPAKPAAAEPARQNPTGWSKAARRRAGHTDRSHPLGLAVESGDGYTVYEDTAFGGGRVQIWDES